MVAYGPWTQDDDFHVFSTVNTNDVANYTQSIADAGEETDYQEPVRPIGEGDLRDAFDAAQVALEGRGAWIEFLDSTYNLSLPKWKSSWGVRMWSRTIHIGGQENLYNPPNYGSTPPEGAIGIDYENRPYDPEDPWGWSAGVVQTFHLGVQSFFEGQFEDGRVVSGAPLPWAVDSYLYITPAGGSPTLLADVGSPANDTANNWLVKNFAAEIDLAPYGATGSDDWTADLYTVTPDVVVGGDPAPFENTYTRYGWLLKSLRLNRWVRPPLYRWVYDTEAPTYRRSYPRDDGLAGGARRNYPPSRAVQSGNRTSGGYL